MATVNKTGLQGRNRSGQTELRSSFHPKVGKLHRIVNYFAISNLTKTAVAVPFIVRCFYMTSKKCLIMIAFAIKLVSFFTYPVPEAQSESNT